jgi:methylase of polypeptide subunit release factors
VVSADEALLELLQRLKAADYHFTAVTPTTHARVLARPCTRPDVRDIFGWSRPFQVADLDSSLFECLRQSELLESHDGKLRSAVRVASLDGNLFLHSAYPTDSTESVFFGPDTYRFVRAVRQHPAIETPRWIVDMGAGSGAGAITAARSATRITAIDVNPLALRFATINAKAAGVGVETLQSSELPNGADLVIANPPYIMDDFGRTYRDGGGLFGGEVALNWAKQALQSLAPRGTMLLYTGASVVAGQIPLASALQAACANADARLTIEETDPDVFGEELDSPGYADVERIAVITATIRKP